MCKIQDAINDNSHPEMALQAGMVFQVYSDGEITLQKSGELLGQRNIHTIKYPLEHYKTGYNWENHTKKYGFIFTDKDGAETVRELLKC